MSNPSWLALAWHAGWNRALQGFVPLCLSWVSVRWKLVDLARISHDILFRYWSWEDRWPLEAEWHLMFWWWNATSFQSIGGRPVSSGLRFTSSNRMLSCSSDASGQSNTSFETSRQSRILWQESDDIMHSNRSIYIARVMICVSECCHATSTYFLQYWSKHQ